MDIDRPVVEHGGGKPTLFMFCPEERYPREIFWAGFGFQVWCQMLTHVIQAKRETLLVIDEPDIYLHSDLQRQLLTLLQDWGPDATHSTEIITEVEPSDLLVINKRARAAKRVRDAPRLQKLFALLGSNLNPTLTQLAKSRRGLFVEGKDFRILSAFAQKLGKQEIANRSDFAVIPVDGFNPTKADDYSKGIELTLGSSMVKGIILDRDYRLNNEIERLELELSKFASFTHIHRRKEIENYLLEPIPLERAIKARISEQNARTGMDREFREDTCGILDLLSDSMKNDVRG